MNVQVKSSNGVTTVPANSYFLSKRKLFIEGEITPDSALEFFKGMLLLNQEETDHYIDVYINSNGGELNAGMLVIQLIKNSKAPVRLWCVGKAYSMASLILSSGVKGNRFIFPSSEVMIHEPILTGSVSGSSSSIRSISDSLMETRSNINRMLAENTGRTIEEINAATSYDHFFTPEEAIDFGICDAVGNVFEVTKNEL